MIFNGYDINGGGLLFKPFRFNKIIIENDAPYVIFPKSDYRHDDIHIYNTLLRCFNEFTNYKYNIDDYLLNNIKKNIFFLRGGYMIFIINIDYKITYYGITNNKYFTLNNKKITAGGILLYDEKYFYLLNEKQKGYKRLTDIGGSVEKKDSNIFVTILREFHEETYFSFSSILTYNILSDYLHKYGKFLDVKCNDVYYRVVFLNINKIKNFDISLFINLFNINKLVAHEENEKPYYSLDIIPITFKDFFTINDKKYISYRLICIRNAMRSNFIRL